jgi:hypothetical protein
MMDACRQLTSLATGLTSPTRQPWIVGNGEGSQLEKRSSSPYSYYDRREALGNRMEREKAARLFRVRTASRLTLRASDYRA